jgi:glutathione S-transferase/alpha,alpha-trehalase
MRIVPAETKNQHPQFGQAWEAAHNYTNPGTTRPRRVQSQLPTAKMLFVGLSMILAFASTATAFLPVRSTSVSCVTGRQSTTSLSMSLTLYGSRGSRSPLVNWAANELDIPIEAGDLSKNPHPFGQIPCLTDDNGVVVFESGAILNYLQSKANDKGIHGDATSAAVTSWISWANASLDPICFLETPDGKV